VTTETAAQYPSTGCRPGALTLPQVRAALILLTRADLPLAAIADTGHIVRSGAYLDPRSHTGEVVLSYESEWADWVFNRSHADRMRRATVTKEAADSYRRLFADETDWQVTECADPNTGGPLPRFILKPPAFTCEVFVSPRAGHCTAPAVRVIHSAATPADRMLVCEAHPRTVNQFTAPGWTTTTPAEYGAAHGAITQDAPIIGGRRAPQD